MKRFLILLAAMAIVLPACTNEDNECMNHSWKDGVCANCGEECSHTWENGTCTVCGTVCGHTWENGTCIVCGTVCEHTWKDGACTVCGTVCGHTWENGTCIVCGTVCEHTWKNGTCIVCGTVCEHTWDNGTCTNCGAVCGHTWKNGTCIVCGTVCAHGATINGFCEYCGLKLFDYNEDTHTATVSTAEGLLAWKKTAYFDTSLNLTLAADITLTSENNWTTTGKHGEYNTNYNIDSYAGFINGGGHTITNLYINSSSNVQGFIGSLNENGKIKDLTFVNAQVTAGMHSGIISGANDGVIENCHVISGSMTATNGYSGSITCVNSGIVIGCSNAATITIAEGCTESYLGGIVGTNVQGTIIGCINTGTVSGYRSVGGVAGLNDFGIVVASGNTGTVAYIDYIAGGIVANIGNGATTIGSWTIDTYEHDSKIEITEGKDGIGYNYMSYITHCYSGDVTTINEKVSDMNTAIAKYNAGAAEGKSCPYEWQVTADGYPTLVKSK